MSGNKTEIDHGFVTDDRGQRLYFPPIGAGRFPPSAEAEIQLRERDQFFLHVTFVVVFAVAGSSYFLSDPVVSLWAGVAALALLVASRTLLGGFLTRGWRRADEPGLVRSVFVVRSLHIQSVRTIVVRAISSVAASLFISFMLGKSVLEAMRLGDQGFLGAMCATSLILIVPVLGLLRQALHCARALRQRSISA